MGTQNIDDLGKVRGETLRKAWHPCGNPPHGETDFYPLLVLVGETSAAKVGEVHLPTLLAYIITSHPSTV